MSHPIAPPLELVQQWADMLASRLDEAVFSLAAQWGADQELEACCHWLREIDEVADELRLARRPKPPSLKEQALAALKRYEAEEWCEEMTFDSSVIRRALEQLDD